MLSINWSWIPIAKTTVTAAEIWGKCFQKNSSKKLSTGISISWSKILAFYSLSLSCEMKYRRNQNRSIARLFSFNALPKAMWWWRTTRCHYPHQPLNPHKSPRSLRSARILFLKEKKKMISEFKNTIEIDHNFILSSQIDETLLVHFVPLGLYRHSRTTAWHFSVLSRRCTFAAKILLAAVREWW